MVCFFSLSYNTLWERPPPPPPLEAFPRPYNRNYQPMAYPIPCLNTPFPPPPLTPPPSMHQWISPLGGSSRVILIDSTSFLGYSFPLRLPFSLTLLASIRLGGSGSLVKNPPQAVKFPLEPNLEPFSIILPININFGEDHLPISI